MKNDKVLNVGIVGGGPGCKAIMDMIFAEKLSQLRMNLIGVASTNTEAAGYLDAVKKGFYTTTDYRDLYDLKDLNMIIELTGADEVAAEISRSKPDHVRLMDHVAARLFWDVFQIEEERITERRQAEAALAAAEREKDAILGSIVEHVVHQDRNLKILWANRSACESAGLPLEELIGRHCYEIWARRPDICPDCPVAVAMETGLPQEVEKWTPDGRAWYVRGHPMRDDEGKIVGAVELTLEMTERKQAEEALLESEEKYRQLFDMESDAIFLIDKETGQILEANASAASVYGYSREELLQRKNTDLSADPDGTRTATVDGSVRIPLRYHKKKDGTVFPVEITARHFEWRGRDVHVAAVRDITFRFETEERTRKLQSQLQQVQKLESIGTLAGGIAHDFNNLLMGIQGQISLMLINRDPDNVDYERLENMEKQVESGARLTSLLLGYARKGKYEVRPINLNQLIEEACETFGRTKKDIVVHLDLDDELHSIEADPGQIEQILFNLCVNASDAMPNGGDLFVKTVNTTHEAMTDKLYEPKPGGYVMLTVTDRGMGMDKDVMGRIFDPFFTTKEMGRGTGLGLASAYGITKAHGGYIDVESELGQGTTFSLYFPMSEKTVEKAAGRDEQIVQGSETVLLVDDEEAVRHVGKELLRTLGYRVILASNGEEALELYEQNPDQIDIVLLDMVMPGMGGSEAYDRLKGINPHVKVLLFSGYSIDGQASEILERGCNGFIQKPFSRTALSSKMREILDEE